MRFTKDNPENISSGISDIRSFTVGNDKECRRKNVNDLIDLYYIEFHKIY